MPAPSPSIRHITRNRRGEHTSMQWPRTLRLVNAQPVRCADGMRRARSWRRDRACGSRPYFSGRSRVKRMRLQSTFAHPLEILRQARKSGPPPQSTSLLTVVLACVLRACRTLPRDGQRPPKAVEAARRAACQRLWRTTRVHPSGGSHPAGRELAADAPTVMSGSALGAREVSHRSAQPTDTARARGRGVR